MSLVEKISTQLKDLFGPNARIDFETETPYLEIHSNLPETEVLAKLTYLSSLLLDIFGALDLRITKCL